MNWSGAEGDIPGERGSDAQVQVRTGPRAQTDSSSPAHPAHARALALTLLLDEILDALQVALSGRDPDIGARRRAR